MPTVERTAHRKMRHPKPNTEHCTRTLLLPHCALTPLLECRR
jgi:hypothetical protein